MLLRLEVAVLEHPGHLDDAAQLDLAPAAADVRAVAERADEVAGLAAQLLLRLGERAHLLGERRVGARARDLELLQLAVDLLERLLERRDEVLDRLLALVEILRRLLLQLLELGLRKLEERLLFDASASAASAFIVVSSDGRESVARRASQAAAAPMKRPMRTPMTIGPTNARGCVGWNGHGDRPFRLERGPERERARPRVSFHFRYDRAPMAKQSARKKAGSGRRRAERRRGSLGGDADTAGEPAHLADRRRRRGGARDRRDRSESRCPAGRPPRRRTRRRSRGPRSPGSRPAAALDSSSAVLSDRLPILGLDALGAEGEVIHIHQHLDIYLNGTKVTVPALVGIDTAGQFLTQLHTHDTTGILHVESPTKRSFRLGEFFGEWGVRLTSTCLGTYCGHLHWWVNGTKMTGNPAQLVLQSHQEIVLAVGKPPAHIPSSYKFPQGL